MQEGPAIDLPAPILLSPEGRFVPERQSERSIKRCEQTFSSCLARDGALCAKGIWPGSDTCSNASVSVPNQNAPLLIHCGINEVEQVAIIAAGGSAQADRAALHWIVRSGVYQSPCCAAIERMCNVEMPHAGEVGCVLGVAACWCAKEGERGAVAIACNHGRERHVLDTERGSNISDVRPGSAVIVRNRHHGMTVAAVPAEIYGVVCAYSDRGIAIAGRAAGNSVDGPCSAIVP